MDAPLSLNAENATAVKSPVTDTEAPAFSRASCSSANYFTDVSLIGFSFSVFVRFWRS